MSDYTKELEESNQKLKEALEKERLLNETLREENEHLTKKLDRIQLPSGLVADSWVPTFIKKLLSERDV